MLTRDSSSNANPERAVLTFRKYVTRLPKATFSESDLNSLSEIKSVIKKNEISLH